MRAMVGSRAAWLFVLMVPGLALASAAWADTDLDAVREAEAQRQEALIAGDAALLEVILADDLTYTHSQGRVQTKAELIASLTSGRVRYRSIVVDDPEPRLVSDSAAVVTSPASMVVEAAGRTMNLRSRFLAVYGRRGDGWKLVAYQSTSLKSKEPDGE